MQHKVAVIGCGHWGKNLVRNFSELGALGAICDPDPDIATRIAEQYKVTAVGFETICEDDEISGLVIAAPAPLHAPLSLQALAARKHIFVEKPLAMNCQESESMIVAAAEPRPVKNKRSLRWPRMAECGSIRQRAANSRA